MSCEKCEEAQNDAIWGDGKLCYVRIGRANVMVVGCEKHIKDLLDKLCKADAEGKNAKNI